MKTLIGLSIVAVLFALSSAALADSRLVTKKASFSKSKVLWDGDNESFGQSWVSYSDKIRDSARLVVDDEGGFSSHKALRFEAAGASYMGFGWNWLNAWEVNDGMDLSKYKTLSFRFKAGGTKLPTDINSITFQLAGGGGDPVARSKAYAASLVTREDIMSGDWHKVVIPLKTFFNTKNPEAPGLDETLVREFSIGVNPREYVDFDIFIDDLKVSK